MTGRLIVVSNRIPTGALPSGGLVVAIHDALSEEGGLWIGAHPEPVENPEDALIDLQGAGYGKKAFRLSAEEVENFYLGYANSVLWPLCHRRSDLVRYAHAFAEAYMAVNARVARQVAELVTPADLVWVQDYHFLPLALELRKLGVQARIGLFLHIPFPVLADAAILPERDELARWFAAYDLVGLQTRADVARFLEFSRAEASCELLVDGRVHHRDRVFEVRSFPIGIDVADFATQAAQGKGGELVNLGAREDLVIGVDRLDYSKGLPQKVRAFGKFMDGRKSGDRRASLLQIAPPSREDVEAYREIRDELEQLAGSVNGDHAELDWTPINYIHRHVSRDRLAVLFRVARVGLVTPLVDGMNLVAKEFVAAQDPDDPGVLVLSHMAGAAEDMTAAVLVNPHDLENMALAIETALTMPLAERKRRHAELLDTVKRTDIGIWRREYLNALQNVEAPLSLHHGSLT